MRSRTYSPLEYAARWARKLKKVQAKKLVKYEWHQFHGKLEECKQTADLSIQEAITFLSCVLHNTKKAVLHFDEISTLSFALYYHLCNRCIFQKLWAPILMLYVQGVHFVNH